MAKRSMNPLKSEPFISNYYSRTIRTREKMCFRGSKTIPDMSCFRSSKSLQAMSYKWNAWITKVLWLSCFFSNYQFVSFGGCFWIFGASNNPDSLLFLFSCHCQSVSCYCQQKKFCPNFSDATLLPALLQKRCEIC